jgi:hypothetical protein
MPFLEIQASKIVDGRPSPAMTIGSVKAFPLSMRPFYTISTNIRGGDFSVCKITQ